DDVRIERVVVDRGRLRSVGCEAEALVLLVERIRARRGAFFVIGLAAIEIGIVRSVYPDALVGIAAGEAGRCRSGHGCEQHEERHDGEPGTTKTSPQRSPLSATAGLEPGQLAPR